jgi:hypothetical protein
MKKNKGCPGVSYFFNKKLQGKSGTDINTEIVSNEILEKKVVTVSSTQGTLSEGGKVQYG